MVKMTGLVVSMLAYAVAAECPRHLHFVNEVPLETYLRGVVPHEIGASAPYVAVEASYYCANPCSAELTPVWVDNYQLCADTQCQVYMGLSGAVPNTDRAIAATRGRC